MGPGRVISAVVGTLVTVGIPSVGAGASVTVLPAHVSDFVTYFVLILLLALVAPYVLARLWPDAVVPGTRPPGQGRASAPVHRGIHATPSDEGPDALIERSASARSRGSRP